MRNRDKCIIIKIYFTPETPVTLSRIALNIDNENLRRREKREGGEKDIWRNKAKSISNLKKYMNQFIQEAKQTPNKINSKRSSLRHRISLLKAKAENPKRSQTEATPLCAQGPPQDCP